MRRCGIRSCLQRPLGVKEVEDATGLEFVRISLGATSLDQIDVPAPRKSADGVDLGHGEGARWANTCNSSAAIYTRNGDGQSRRRTPGRVIGFVVDVLVIVHATTATLNCDEPLGLIS